MNTNLVYSGILEVETTSRTHKQHNMGTSHLFRLFSVLLCGEEFTPQSLPGYFMLYRNPYTVLVDHPDVAEHQSSQLLREYLDIRSSYSSSDSSSYSSNFTSILDASQLLNTSASYPTLSLGLISHNKKDILAAVEFDQDVYNTIRTGGQAILKWIMTVSNSRAVALSNVTIQ